MKRPLTALLPALLLVLPLAGCSAIPIPRAAAPDQGAAGLGATDADPSAPAPYADGAQGQEQGQAPDGDEAPLHTCTWEGEDGDREDIAIFGTSDDEPFTRVQLVQRTPTKTDLVNNDPEVVQQYLDRVRDILVNEDGVDPSILTVDVDDDGLLRVTYECRNLDDLQSVHDYYYDDTAGGVFRTVSGMPGVTTCDGKPVEKADIADFDTDMATIREWAEANRETGKAFLNGTLDEDASKKYMDETHAISDLMRKWKRSQDILNDEQKKTYQEVKKSLAETMLVS